MYKSHPLLWLGLKHDCNLNTEQEKSYLNVTVARVIKCLLYFVSAQGRQDEIVYGKRKDMQSNSDQRNT